MSGRQSPPSASGFDVIELGPADSSPRLAHLPEVPPLSDADRAEHAPDCHLIVRDASGIVVARGSCWSTGLPPLEAERVGAIGHYAASGSDSGAVLLAHACGRLQSAGCARVVGPLDGNTWRSYRLVSDAGSEPAFFLEPSTPQSWCAHWRDADFSPIAEYTSARADDLSAVDPRVERAAARLAANGIVIRQLATAPDDDLRRIFDVARESFAGNFLYSPIEEAEFLEQTRRLLPFVRPELVLLAERRCTSGDTRVCGFVFAVPDVLQMRRGGAVDTVVVKTVAVRPASGVQGLGSVLVSRVHDAARRLGYRRAIHALMHESNVSRNISRRYAATMRKYALFGKRLGA